MTREDANTIEGPCCGCGLERPLLSILMLPRRGAIGKGWGCVICKLPSDCAIAMMCDRCMERGVDPAFACAGYAMDRDRIPIAELPDGLFEHDPSVDHEAA
jgi:hypothetical protein